MISQLDIDFPPLPSQVPPPAPQPPPPTSEQQIQSIYSTLVHQLTRLQTTFVLHAESNNEWHKFLIPYLPPLLTIQRANYLAKFRHALSIVSLTLVECDNPDPRYRNFTNALLWTLDGAENAMRGIGEDAELRVVRVIRTIFESVIRFCNEEWGLETSSSDSDQVPNTAAEPPSKKDPTYHPQVVRKRKRVKEAVASTEDDANESSPNGLPESYSLLFPSNSHYIRCDGKLITPFACIQEGPKKFLIPFQMAVKEKSSPIHESLELPSKHLEIRYPDGTFYDFVPVQKVRFIYQKYPRHLPSNENVSSEKQMGCIEVDGSVFDTIIKISKRAYKKSLSRSKVRFFTDIKLPLPRKRTEVRIPTAPSCYVCVADGQRFKEYPIWEAFNFCKHDLIGYALFKVEFLEQIDGTRILISLTGMTVEKNLSNYGNAIFGLLDL